MSLSNRICPVKKDRENEIHNQIRDNKKKTGKKIYQKAVKM